MTDAIDERLAAVWWEKLGRAVLADRRGNENRSLDERSRAIVSELLRLHASPELHHDANGIRDEPLLGDLTDERHARIAELMSDWGEHLGVGPMPPGAYECGRRRSETS